jgi:hypothetical protein
VGCYVVLVDKLLLTYQRRADLSYSRTNSAYLMIYQHCLTQLLFYNCWTLKMCLILQNVITTHIYESTHHFPYECIFSNITVRTSNFAHGGEIHTSAVFSSLIIEQREVECWSVLQWQNVQYHIS